jgi:DNA-binding protein Fis
MPKPPNGKKVEIFDESRKLKKLYKSFCDMGYVIFHRCKFCGAWTTEEDFCNSDHSKQFERIKHKFPKFRATEEEIGHLRNDFLNLQDAYRNILNEYINLKALKPVAEVLKKPFTISEMEKEVILYKLKFHNFNFLKTAKSIGVTRRTLYNKLDEYGIKNREALKEYYN